MLLCLQWLFPVVAKAGEDILTITRNAGYEVLDKNKPVSSIVIEADTGQILWEQDIDIPRNPASLTKVMSVLLAYDAISEGLFTLDTQVVATDEDSAISKIWAISNNTIVSGVDYSVRDLLLLTLVPSSNVATLMLTRLIEADDRVFLDKMNAKAQELGMNHTYFNNMSGAAASVFNGYYLPEGYDSTQENTTTARDLAIMTYHLLKKYPEILGFTKDISVTTKKGTPYEETFEAYNHSLPGGKYGFDGVDGLKTGSSPMADFNYIATAKQGDTRLIEVVLGVGEWSDQEGEYYRHPFGNAIFQYVFDRFERRKILNKGKNVINGQNIVLEEDFYATVEKGGEVAVELKDGLIQTVATRELVSEKLSPSYLGFKVDEAQEIEEEKEKKVAGDSTNGSNNKSLISITFAFTGILFIFLYLRKVRTRENVSTRSERKKRLSFLTLAYLPIGCVLILYGFLHYFL